MKGRDIVLGLGILVVIAGIVIWQKDTSLPTSPEVSQKTEQTIEEIFMFDIPDDVEKIELTNTTNEGFLGVATRSFSEDGFIHNLLVDLPDPVEGMFYEGWLIGEGDSRISTGRLRIAKGGFLLEFESGVDYTSHNKVEVTLEKIADSEPEKLIFKGSF